jgi:hypothetical protein
MVFIFASNFEFSTASSSTYCAFWSVGVLGAAAGLSAADLLRRLSLLAFDFEDRFVCSACGKLLVLLSMRFAGLQCLQDGTFCRKSPFDVVAQDGSFFRKPQFDVIALGIREMRLKQSAITSDVVAMRVHEGGFSVHDVTSSCRAYSIVFSSRKCCGKRFTDTFAQYRTSSVIGP